MRILDNKKFGMISLGCDKNRVDAERLLGEIRARGYAITDDIAEAEILIVNTCAFLNEARKEAIDTVLECDEYRRAGKLEKLVVTGCLPEKFAAELFPSLTEGDVFLGCGDADVLFDAIERSYREGRVNAVGSGGEWKGQRVLTTPLHYGYLKIADGCSNHCTYCLIPKIRGKYRSERMEDLVAEAKSLGELSELILVAQDTTRYGEDLYGENKFVELIRRLSALDTVGSIRLLYCYPEVITDALIDEVAQNDKVVKYLDIPLQHSEDRILKLMNRRGTRASYLALVEKLRARIPGVAIRSTFIAGFPSETAAESEALASFLREAKLTNCGFFAYSREPDTPAYRLPGQVSARVKSDRVRALYAVQRGISAEFLRSKVGTFVDVLCDGIDYEGGRFVGRAYWSAPDIDGKVYFRAPFAEQGRTYRVLITEADSYDLFGQTEEQE